MLLSPLITLFSLSALSVSTGTAAVSGSGSIQSESNAMRLARGLPPNKPASLFDSRKRALKPRASLLPTPALNNQPGESCGCTFLSQTDAVAQATGLYETSPQNSAQDCLNRCDTSIDCQVGVFRSATSQCELYNGAVDSSSVTRSHGDAYFSKFSCSGTCTPPPVYNVAGGNSCGCNYNVYAEVAATFPGTPYDTTTQTNVAACISRCDDSFACSGSTFTSTAGTDGQCDLYQSDTPAVQPQTGDQGPGDAYFLTFNPGGGTCAGVCDS